jgi:hypothetical protein
MAKSDNLPFRAGVYAEDLCLNVVPPPAPPCLKNHPETANPCKLMDFLGFGMKFRLKCVSTEYYFRHVCLLYVSVKPVFMGNYLK